MNTPVGLPLPSFWMISDATGETVSRVMPARVEGLGVGDGKQRQRATQKPQIGRM